MADKRIQDLPLVLLDEVSPQDRMLLEHSDDAYAMLVQDFINKVLQYADGHGGISEPAKLIKTDGLVDTYQFTYADGSTSNYSIKNGKGIQSITLVKTVELIDTYRVTYNDQTFFDYDIRNGASGVYLGKGPVPPTANVWLDTTDGASPVLKVRILGGWQIIDAVKGDPAIIKSETYEYQVSDSGTVEPAGPWLPNLPIVKGKYIWTRITTTWNHSAPTVRSYATYQGADGIGQVNSVDGIKPDPVTHDTQLSVWTEDVAIMPGQFTEYIPKIGEETALHKLGYVFRAGVPVAGALENMFPRVTLSPSDLEKSGAQIASVAQSYSGGFYLYAKGKPGQPITALTVELRKAAV